MTTLEDSVGYDDNIQSMDMAFDRSKSEKKHAQKVIEFEKILGIEESLHMLILQAVEGLYPEVLKEEYIRYGGKLPFKMISHAVHKLAK